MKISYLLLGSLLLFFNSYIYAQEITLDKLVKLKSHTLQENDSIIISEIGFSSYNSDCSKLAISSPSIGDMVIIYDSIGKISNVIKPVYFIADSIYFKTKVWRKGYKIVSINDLLTNKENERFSTKIISLLNHSYYKSIFINDTILAILGRINCYICENSNLDYNIKNISLASFCSIILFDVIENKINCIFSFDKSVPYWAQPKSFAYDTINKYYYCTCSNLSGSNDSLSIISLYSESGKYVKKIANLPNEYIQSGIEYKANCDPEFILNRNNELIGIFPYIEKIFNFTNNTSFSLKGLKDSNYLGFDILFQDNEIISNNLDTLLYIFPHTIDNIYLTNRGSYLIIISHKLKNQNKVIEYIIQEYSTDGCLLYNVILPFKIESGSILHISYNKCRDLVVTYSIDKKLGWTVTFWERK